MVMGREVLICSDNDCRLIESKVGRNVRGVFLHKIQVFSSSVVPDNKVMLMFRGVVSITCTVEEILKGILL
jgi:hypothetical protein